MPPLEEPTPQFDEQSTPHNLPFDQLPPRMKQAVEALFQAMDDDPQLQEHMHIWTQSVTSTQQTTFQPNSASQPWARWEYSAAEWQHLDRLDWSRATRRFLFRIAFWTGLAAFFYIGLLICAELTSRGSLYYNPQLLWAILIPLSFVFIFSFAFNITAWWQARQRHLARQKGPQRVTIGPLSSFDNQALWQAGFYIPLQELFLKLTKVQLTANPPLLILHRKYTGRSPWRDTLYIPVPPRYQAEAAQLVERFRQETIASQKKDRTPPEP